jgi:hypothetical protein
MTDRTQTQSGHVVAKLGGIAATARLLGHRHASTVQGWVASGFIPSARHAEILAAARKAHLQLDDTDFIWHLRQAEAPSQAPSCAPQVAAA